MALGDSFTAGASEAQLRAATWSEPAGGAGADAPVPWPDRLAELLRRENARLDYRNLAVAGASSDDVASRQLHTAVALAPQLVTLVCGANDVLHSVRPDIDAYAATFSAMLERLRIGLPDAAIVTATTPDFSRFLPLRRRSRERVARGMRQLNATTLVTARDHGVPCLDFAGHPGAGERSNFAADGIHGSADGHRHAAANVARALAAHFGVKIPPLHPEEGA